MDTEKSVKKLKKEVDFLLKKFFLKEICRSSKVDYVLKEATEIVANYTLRGGKRIRAVLFYYGYLTVASIKKKEVLKVSLAMELFHSFLLIQDDIIDQDQTRRGGPTVHERYRRIFCRNKKIKNERLNEFFALLCGDIAYAHTLKIIGRAPFTFRVKLKIIQQLQTILLNTITGEMLDVLGDLRRELEEKDILKIYKYKTAKYTIEGPLILGCILGGGGGEIRKVLSKYAVLLGVAFQIHDDILGIFGNIQETGKDPCSDLREGRKTLLVLKVLAYAKENDKKFVQNIFGKKIITMNELQRFRKIAEKCGAKDRVLSIANNLSVKAKEIILKSDIREEAKQFLLSATDYLVERKK